MSRSYSDHFNATGIATSLTDTDPNTFALQTLSAGLSHARLRTKIARATVGTAGMTSGDELRMFRMKSSDRLYRLSYSSDGGATTYAANLGLYLTGTSGDGAVVDADLFASALAAASGAALTDVFAESAVLTDEDRGKTLWALAAIGAASYTSDPQIEFDFVFTSTATGTGAVNELLLVAEYTSGD